MSITSILICLSSILILALGKSIPPSLCFEHFIGLDCGGSPLHVLYYYKSGSRCEVGVWRGCPTRNKFQDEYECKNTCIFTERARSKEHHNFGNEDNYQLEYKEDKKTIDEPAATTIAADSGYDADVEGGASGAGEKDRKEAEFEEKAYDEGGANGTGEKDTKETDAEEKADDENAATENEDGDNADDGENAAEKDNENAADEVNKEPGEGDEKTKIEATSEGTMEIGSEDIGAN